MSRNIELDACDPGFFIGWGLSGGIGTPPYVLTYANAISGSPNMRDADAPNSSVQTVGLSILQAQTFGNFTGQLPFVQVAFPSGIYFQLWIWLNSRDETSGLGVQVIFGVQDFHGLQSFTQPITIHSGFKPSRSLQSLRLKHNDPTI